MFGADIGCIPKFGGPRLNGCRPNLQAHETGPVDALRKVLKRLHYLIEVVLVCVRWYAAYPLSLRI